VAEQIARAAGGDFTGGRLEQAINLLERPFEAIQDAVELYVLYQSILG
jgi:hypothetical protein